MRAPARSAGMPDTKIGTNPCRSGIRLWTEVRPMHSDTAGVAYPGGLVCFTLSHLSIRTKSDLAPDPALCQWHSPPTPAQLFCRENQLFLSIFRNKAPDCLFGNKHRLCPVYDIGIG